MRSKASLVLMEQLVMVLVFTLAAALCLQIFVQAEKISVQTARRDEAVVIAQNAAELLKACGDPETAEKLAGSSGFALQIQEESTSVPGLRQARIAVYYEDSLQFSLITGWQEVRE